MPKQVYLCCDPGTANFAWSAISIALYRGDLSVKVLGTGFVSNTVINLNHDQRKLKKDKTKGRGKSKVILQEAPIHEPLKTELSLYADEIELLLEQYKPDVLGIERFQARVASSLSETVGIMNGVMLYKAINHGTTHIHTYPASSWKLWIKKVSNLDEIYHAGAIRGIEPHTVDSIMMALYLHKVLNPDHESLMTDSMLKNRIRTLKV